MTLKLILTKGLPASGKTTWAKDYLARHSDTANLCKDDLRLQFPSTKKREKQVIEVRDLLTEHYLGKGLSVIWSDTNLNPVHTQRATELAAKYEAQLVIQDFTQVSLAECISRDLVRPNSVGQQAITRMYYDYIDKPQPTPVVVPERPNCYLVDVDGTLALNTSRPPFAWERVGEDSLNPAVAELVRQISKNHAIVVLSGRSEVCRDLTLAWLDQHQIPHTELFMRPKDDQRPDDILKADLYAIYIQDRYNVLGVIDDRPKVCRMWRSLGLSVFQVGNPDYEF
jgi:predicted kinase